LRGLRGFVVVTALFAEVVADLVLVVVVDVETDRTRCFGGGGVPRAVVVSPVVPAVVAETVVDAVTVVVVVTAVLVWVPLVVSFGEAATPPPTAANPAAARPTTAAPAARHRRTRPIFYCISALAPA
jgi:hypothetical protein